MGDNRDNGDGDDTGRSGRDTPGMPYTISNPEQNISIYETSRADALSTPLLWIHAYGKDKIEYSKENDELWEILNELAENERILDNKIALLHEEQRRMFEIARNSNSRENANMLSHAMSNTNGGPRNLMLQESLTSDQISEINRDLSRLQEETTSSDKVTMTKSGGKSRRVFRKNTKITRRRNKKSNRHRRTSHVAKQT